MLSVIFALAWPTMLEELMQTAVQYMDTAMVGTLGTQATAAVGATGTVSWLVGSTVSAVGVGFLALISQSYGAGDRERARRASAQAVIMTVIVGLLFTAITTSLSGKIHFLQSGQFFLQFPLIRIRITIHSRIERIFIRIE